MATVLIDYKLEILYFKLFVPKALLSCNTGRQTFIVAMCHPRTLCCRLGSSTTDYPKLIIEYNEEKLKENGGSTNWLLCEIRYYKLCVTKALLMCNTGRQRFICQCKGPPDDSTHYFYIAI